MHSRQLEKCARVKSEVKARLGFGSFQIRVRMIILSLLKNLVHAQTCIAGRSTKIHLYYCMKNSGGDAEVLQSKILSIVNHYQVRI